MSNFLRSLFGVKKAAKVTKSKMQTRRLELIGLEERITPIVTAGGAGGILSLTTTLGSNLTSVVANADGTLTVSATTAVGAADPVVAGSGLSCIINSKASSIRFSFINEQNPGMFRCNGHIFSQVERKRF